MVAHIAGQPHAPSVLLTLIVHQVAYCLFKCTCFTCPYIGTHTWRPPAGRLKPRYQRPTCARATLSAPNSTQKTPSSPQRRSATGVCGRC